MQRLQWLLTALLTPKKLNSGQDQPLTQPLTRWLTQRNAVILAALVVGLSACGGLKRKSQESLNATAQSLDSRLTVQDGILSQIDAQGRPLWQIKVKQAVYSQDQKTAQVKGLAGQLFQDGKSVFQIQAAQGEIHLDSQKIFLKGSIVATDRRDGTVLQGREMEWQPQTDLLTLRQDLRITHPQVQISAREARAFSRTRQIEVQGQVVAVTRQPSLRLRTEQMVWQVAQQQIMANSSQDATSQGVQIERLVGQVGVDRAVAGQAKVSLAAKTVTLRPNTRLSLLNPPLEVASQQLIWYLDRQMIASPQPIHVQHRSQKVTVTAKQGLLNLSQQRLQLTGSVQTTGQRNRSSLKADQLTWLVPTQVIQAEGNVVYQQNQPKFELRGPKAFGKFQEQAVLISGGRVVTEIIP